MYDGTREAGGNSLHHHFHVEDRPANEREEQETQARRRVEEVAGQELKEVVRQEAVTDIEKEQNVGAGQVHTNRGANLFERINRMLAEMDQQEDGESREMVVRSSHSLSDPPPAIVQEQFHYDSAGMVLVSQDSSKPSLYVNITRDGAERGAVDRDGHQLHIHLPLRQHKVT